MFCRDGLCAFLSVRDALSVGCLMQEEHVVAVLLPLDLRRCLLDPLVSAPQALANDALAGLSFHTAVFASQPALRPDRRPAPVQVARRHVAPPRPELARPVHHLGGDRRPARLLLRGWDRPPQLLGQHQLQARRAALLPACGRLGGERGPSSPGGLSSAH